MATDKMYNYVESISFQSCNSTQVHLSSLGTCDFVLHRLFVSLFVTGERVV